MFAFAHTLFAPSVALALVILGFQLLAGTNQLLANPPLERPLNANNNNNNNSTVIADGAADSRVFHY